MAKAGDGQARSGKRRLTATISLRISDAEKQQFEQKALRSGFAGISPWAIDRMRAEHAVAPRAGRILCGHLGHLGAQIETLALNAATIRPTDLRQDLRALGARIVAIQRTIMEGMSDAGQDDSQPRS